MIIEHFPHSSNSLPIVNYESTERRTVASYKRRLIAYRRTEIQLREALARDDVMLRQMNELIQNQALLSKEFRS